jgi:hypothetical protein
MHTLVMVRYSRMAEANALANSPLFANNGDAFADKLFPVGNPSAPDADCWTWCAATYTPERRAALTMLSSSPEWASDCRVEDYDVMADPGHPLTVFASLGLAVYQPELAP